jgi:NAD(P)-dependent dehydrogenase (short-subunit alcohol dehydrogenase family)
MRLKDKVAIVTGAAKGIGAAVAKKFAEEGAKVVLCDLNEAEVKKMEAEIVAAGGTVLGVIANVANRAQVDAMVQAALDKFGTIDILINNAGITRDAMLHKMTEEQWDQVLNVNLKGIFYCTQAVIPTMREKGYGKIVSISSTSRFGNIGQANYAVSKEGVVGFTRTAAKELASKNITVNAIAPGGIWTDMLAAVPDKILEMSKRGIPLGRFGSVEELANACLFLASDDSSFVTGQCLQVDGGTVMP